MMTILNFTSDRKPESRIFPLRDPDDEHRHTRGPSVDLLLVEDNPADVRAFREALKATGIPHELFVVIDGEDALRFLRRQSPYENAAQPQLVVLDLKLPRVSGQAVLGAMRLEPNLRETPVIILTSTAAGRDRAQGQAAPTEHVIRKPVGIQALAAELKIIPRLVKAAAQRATVPAPVPAVPVYLVSPSPDGRWIVEPPRGSGFFFHSLHEAQDFALQLARKNVPSLVKVISKSGAVIGVWNCDQAGLQ
jgi:two-component system, chemotaxis family, response regulator Rcp1